MGSILGLPGLDPDFMGAMRPHTPQFTFSHLNALRAAMRIEAYGLYAQKVTKKAPGDPDPSICLIGLDQIRYYSATEPNSLASDLRWLSFPTSPGGLLRG